MSPNLKIDIEPTPSSQDVSTIEQILTDYNDRHLGGQPWQNLTLVLRDADGVVLGGLRGNTGWGWLYVDTLAVHDSLRGQDWGTRLLASAEQEAIRRGCHSAYLDTFDFQALPFYQKQGYEIFGTLDRFPDDHQRFFLKKTLVAER